MAAYFNLKIKPLRAATVITRLGSRILPGYYLIWYLYTYMLMLEFFYVMRYIAYYCLCYSYHLHYFYLEAYPEHTKGTN